MTDATRRRVVALFPDEADEVDAILAETCAEDLPLWIPMTSEGLERIRFAALKLSDGDGETLREAIRQAHVDWRDVLVAAGFGHDPLAHEHWTGR